MRGIKQLYERPFGNHLDCGRLSTLKATRPAEVRHAVDLAAPTRACSLAICPAAVMVAYRGEFDRPSDRQKPRGARGDHPAVHRLARICWPAFRSTRPLSDRQLPPALDQAPWPKRL